MNSEATVELRSLTVDFPAGRTTEMMRVLDNINLTVQKNEFVAVVGPSGCGKSTLVKAIAGLLRPSEGQVLISGSAPQTSAASVCGVVFQQPSLLPWRTVLGNVLYGIECQGGDRRAARQYALQLIELVGLRGFEHHYPHEISGGMQQRVNLGRALLIDPTILLMDEPFAALDAQTREVMQLELLEIWQRRRKTIIFVTHQIDEALFLSDRVIIFAARPGRVRSEVVVPFPRPRQLSLKRDPGFLEQTDHIWRLIESDVWAAARGRAAPEGPDGHQTPTI